MKNYDLTKIYLALMSLREATAELKGFSEDNLVYFSDKDKKAYDLLQKVLDKKFLDEMISDLYQKINDLTIFVKENEESNNA